MQRHLKKTIYKDFNDYYSTLVRISWGGTSNETVLRSTTEMVSMQGMMKKRPGPTAPPFFTRPNRKITARWYSWENLKKELKDHTIMQIRKKLCNPITPELEGFRRPK